MLQGLVLHGLRHGGKALPKVYHTEAGEVMFQFTSCLLSESADISCHVLTTNASHRRRNTAENLNVVCGICKIL